MGDAKDSVGGSASGKSGVEVLAFSQETTLSKEKHEEQLRKFQLEMRARTIAAPTNDYVGREVFFLLFDVPPCFLIFGFFQDVKMQLRKFEEPICLVNPSTRE
jgi:hypothetical protein